MPELPEVETVKNTLKELILNNKIKDVSIHYESIIEYPISSEFKKQIIGEAINDIERRGKWLIFVLDHYYLFSHLRMEGKYFIKNDEPIEKHEHIVFKLSNGKELRYRDTRKFGRMLLIPKEDILKKGPLTELGLEPWDENLTEEYLLNCFKNKKVPIKQSLLDQSIIAGIGNIYVDEILFLAKLNPETRTCDVNKRQCKDIIVYTRQILKNAIEKGGTTIRSYESSEGVHGRFQNNLLVHNKENEPCPNCGTLIQKKVVGGRGTYWCSRCQKLKNGCSDCSTEKKRQKN